MWRSLLFLIACSHPTKPVDDTTCKDYPDVPSADGLYNRACCMTLAGQPDIAFGLLDRSIKAGLTDIDHTMIDSDLLLLHLDPRWSRTLDHMRAAITAEENKLKEPALHRELLVRVKKDQDARFAFIAREKAGEKFDWSEAEAIDTDNLAWLHGIVEKYGWPSNAMVGKDGAHSAWLLVQHGDKDVAFQKRVLELMKPLTDSGEASLTDYAYLYDRVAVGEHRKQLYGTQFDEHQEPKPIEDEANVEARRKAAGMGTMAEYRAQMLKTYGAPKK